MEHYRKKLKQRSLFLILTMLVGFGFGIYDGLFASAWQRGNDVFSFQCGIAIGAELLAVLKLIQYQRALKEEECLKIEYNKENDERSKTIRAKAGMPMLMLTSGVMLLAGMIAGYYNETIFLTLIATAIVQLTIGAAVKVYYMRKL
jgi:hypothetical protein